MKIRLFSTGGLFLLSALIFAGGTPAIAQTSGLSTIPVVSIQATQPLASSPGQPGVFTVFRQGDTDETLNVYCQIGGSASNGVDYAQISNFVTILAGETSNTITITPLAAPSPGAVTKTVSMLLAPSPLLNPVNYEIGVPSNAVVFITSPGVTNLPPTVGIVSPSDGSIFYTPTNIMLIAKVGAQVGTVTNVEFFANSTDLGPGSSIVLDPPGVNGVTGLVYVYQWQDPAAAKYSLTAVASDSDGASTISPAVNITVFPGPATNPPIVRIISPANGAVFFAPVDIPLLASVDVPPDSRLAGVQFFDGTTSLGFGQPVPLPVAAGNSASPTSLPPGYPTNVYVLVWTNAPVGGHTLTAVATIAFLDHPLILEAPSAPVDIKVLVSPPPATNCPDIVSIVATDPVAVEGTNSWVWMGESNSPPTWAAWPSSVCRSFTNWGPKTATFTVRRFGETNDDLAVAYNIGGTASNGVDYVTLPGTVTVPAAERSASIIIVPIDDGPPDVNKTVILTLAPSTNSPPDYILGSPSRAAAIIVDQPGPCPVARSMADKCFRLSMPGPDGAWFSIERSSDTYNWVPICTNQVVNGSIDFIDLDAHTFFEQFYRVVPLPDMPQSP